MNSKNSTTSDDDALKRMRKELFELGPNKLCADCGKNWADYPSKLCPGCEAYREHTGAL